MLHFPIMRPAATTIVGTTPIIYSIWYAISLLPLWVLYRISDLLFLLVYYVIRYRRKIVRANMVSSFPEKQMRDIVSIEKKYYKWFCDYVVETIKMLTMSRREMKKRMRFENLDLMNNPLSEGRNVSIFLGHYCNWEWIASLGMHFVSNVYPCQLYHPLENQVFDKDRYWINDNSKEVRWTIRFDIFKSSEHHATTFTN